VRDTLSRVGDAEGPVLTSGIFQVGYDEDQPRYAQRDTVIDGETYVYYERSDNPEEAVYQVLFSQVGRGNGDYERVLSDNATVFRWVPPGPGGLSQGDFAPVRRWVLPQLLQVVNLQSSLQLTEELSLYHETALSEQDQNRLSSLDDADNQGVATLTGLKGEALPVGDSLLLSFDLNQRFVQQRYTNLDRVYRAEYNRIWNLDPGEERRDEWVTRGHLRLDWRHELELEAEGGYRQTAPGEPVEE